MNVLGLIPVSARGMALLGLAALLIVSGGGVAWWGLSPRIAKQEERAARAERDLSREQELTALQSRVLEEQQRQLGRIEEVERHMRQLGQQVSSNAAEQSRVFEELKRNDQAVLAYLSQPVPTALGRLYERPETTDPATYRSPAELSAHPMPAAGPASGASQ